MSRNDQPTQDRSADSSEILDPNENTPLLAQGPSTVDASLEAEVAIRPKQSLNGNANGHVKPPHSLRHPSEDDGHTRANQTLTPIRITLCAMALGCLMLLQASNISLLTTTQSTIAKELDAYEKTSWFTSSYLIAMSSLSPLSGKLSSVFSPRTCIFVAAFLLAIGMLTTGAAQSFEAFVAGRAVAGMGASGVFTISIIIVLELTGSKNRGLGIGLVNSGYTFGVAIGATAAGALRPLIGWRMLFYLQAPLAILAGTVLLLAIPHDFTAGRGRSTSAEPGHDHDRSTWKRLAQLDYLGALALTASIVLLLYSLSSPRKIPLLPILLSALVLATFILIETRLAHDPIIPVALLRSRGLLLTCLGTVGYMMARWSVLFYTPTYALAVRQWTPVTSGSILIPTNLGFAAGGLAVGWLHIRRPGSFYLPSVVVYALFPATLVALALLSTQHSAAPLFLLDVLANGAVTGAALNYNLAHLLHLTPRSTHYVATSLVATFRGFAGSFGSAVGGGLFTRTLFASLERNFAARGLTHREELIRQLLGSAETVRELSGVEREVAIQGYEDGLRTLFLAAAGLAALMVFVQAGTGWKGASEERARSVVEEERRALIEGATERET